MVRRFVGLACVLVSVASPSAQSDLDALMARVLARRDDNWKKLQQYVLDEQETFQLLGSGGRKLYGFQREYLWFPRDPSTSLGADPSTSPAAGGRFVRSPVS